MEMGCHLPYKVLLTESDWCHVFNDMFCCFRNECSIHSSTMPITVYLSNKWSRSTKSVEVKAVAVITQFPSEIYEVAELELHSKHPSY